MPYVIVDGSGSWSSGGTIFKQGATLIEDERVLSDVRENAPKWVTVEADLPEGIDEPGSLSGPLTSGDFEPKKEPEPEEPAEHRCANCDRDFASANALITHNQAMHGPEAAPTADEVLPDLPPPANQEGDPEPERQGPENVARESEAVPA